MRVAIIDIGSNAIRAAIYDNNSLGAAEIFNEKFRSDITSLLEMDKMDIKHGTYSVFNYFISVFENMDVSKILCVATEVLRNRPKSEEFILEIKKRYNIDIRVLSGNEEARITAEGLISSIPDAAGVAADLGGGSLELAEVYSHAVHQVKSLPLGTKILNKSFIEDPVYIEKSVSEVFQDVKCENLYLIGGALRLLGRCYMDYNKSVIKNLHNLVIHPDEFVDFLKQLESLNKFEKFFKQYKINKSAIAVSLGLINFFKPSSVIVSTYGLKEGVRFGILSKEEQSKDIVYERCAQFISPYVKGLSLSEYKELFLELIPDFNDNTKILEIALMLSQYTKNIDINYKAEWVINFILVTDIPFNQKQRAYLVVIMAYALSVKYNIIPKSIRNILSRNDNASSQAIGAFIRIAMLIDGPVLSKPKFKISTNGKYFDLDAEKSIPRTVYEKVQENLKILGISRKILRENRNSEHKNTENIE